MNIKKSFLQILIRALLVVILSTALLGLVACGKKETWETKDISNLMPDLKFTLKEANHGKTVTAKDYRSKVLLLYFGYTNCPDVCPTTLSRFSSIISKLGPEGNPIRFLFVTVDPKRDSLKKIKAYTHFFGPEFIGMRGTQEQLKTLTKRYRVTYGYNKPDANGNYEVSHSSGIYVFGPEGKARILIRPTDSTNAINHDLKQLLAGSM